MRVIHISADDVTGGAARCAYRLHRGLRELGHDSRMLVARKRSDDTMVRRLDPPASRLERLGARLRQHRIDRAHAPYRTTGPERNEPFSDDRSPWGRALVRRLHDCDVVQLHWVAGLVDYGAFFGGLPAALPVVWTLHDMNPFTGGCHYDAGCRRYRGRCGACPQLGSLYPLDLSREVWQRKRDLFARVDRDRLHIVAPSRWLAHAVERSTIFGKRFRVSVIPYGVDTEAFAPRDRGVARETLGIAEDARVVLFAAHSATNRRKGFASLAVALERVTHVPGLVLLSIGKGAPPAPPTVPHVHLRYADDERLLSLVYSAADVFVVPSSQDNLPATALEALACGVPVVAFRVGGLPDAVRPGLTGALAEPDDTDGLGDAICNLLEDDGLRRELGEAARRVVVTEYALHLQARRYAELYRELHGGGDSVRPGRSRAHAARAGVGV